MTLGSPQFLAERIRLGLRSILEAGAARCTGARGGSNHLCHAKAGSKERRSEPVAARPARTRGAPHVAGVEAEPLRARHPPPRVSPLATPPVGSEARARSRAVAAIRSLLHEPSRSPQAARHAPRWSLPPIAIAAPSPARVAAATSRAPADGEHGLT